MHFNSLCRDSRVASGFSFLGMKEALKELFLFKSSTATEKELHETPNETSPPSSSTLLRKPKEQYLQARAAFAREVFEGSKTEQIMTPLTYKGQYNRKAALSAFQYRKTSQRSSKSSVVTFLHRPNEKDPGCTDSTGGSARFTLYQTQKMSRPRCD